MELNSSYTGFTFSLMLVSSGPADAFAEEDMARRKETAVSGLDERNDNSDTLARLAMLFRERDIEMRCEEKSVAK